MADTPEVHHGGGDISGFLKQSTAGLPNWAWILVIGVGIVAAIYVPKLLGQKASSSSTTTGASNLGYAVDPTTGLPYAVEGITPGNPTTSSTTTSASSTFQARPKTTDQNNPAYQFDQSNPGIPIRSAPNASSSILGFIPFGSSVSTTGSAITGSSNFGNPGQGSSQWYPVGGGYISAYDLVASQNTNYVTWPYNQGVLQNG